MRHQSRQRAGRRLSLAALAVIGLVGGSALPALAAPGAVTSPAGRASASASSASASSASASSASASSASTARAARKLLLVTGDRLLVRHSGGAQQVAVLPGVRNDAVISLRFGGQVMEIPAYALPYLGRGLSPSLFQVSALEKAESGRKLRVEMTFAGYRPSIPGLRVTRSSRGVARGYLTASSARKFGAALRRQYRADHSRGRFGTDGLFGHSVSISLPGAAVSPGPAPDFKMHTLTVRGRNLKGKPDTGDDVFIASADSVGRFDGLQETDNFFYHGATKFSVPAGHYWAIASFFNITKTGGSLRMVVMPQFTVRGEHATLHIAEKSASSKVAFSTPRPVSDLQTSVEFVRQAADGSTFSSSYGWGGNLTGWVNPTTRKPTVGTLQSFTSATLTSPAGVSPGYAYNLDFPAPAGIIPPQTYAVTPAGVATVAETYYQEKRSAGGWVAFGGSLAQLEDGEFQEVALITMPQAMTQYFTAGPAMLWSEETFTNVDEFEGGDSDIYRVLGAGQSQAQEWNRYPLHPAPDVSPGGFTGVSFPTEVSAARSGDLLSLNVIPFSDNQFGHLGSGLAQGPGLDETGTYVVDQNGVRIAHGSALDGLPIVKLSARPSVLRFRLSANRASSFFGLSARSRTVWTWRSAGNAAARVPASWFCLREGFVFTQRCAVQPMMTLNYRVQGMSLYGAAPPGGQAIELTAGHIQLGGSAAITGATAQVSFNDGATWQAAAVTPQGGGHFRVAYDAPAGVDVTLRVSATDAAGGSIQERIADAYKVSS